ncbi:uncharacterized protein LOC116248751 [Nymphaea colorata]|nr:uncharacterized protein LOC116248751 [Nymphaea colorata]
MALDVRQGNELTGFSFSSSASSSFSRRPSLVTLQLFDLNSASSSPVELDQGSALPLGWHGFLDLKGECLYYKQNQACTMNRKDKQQGMNGKLDLKLNLSPPKDGNGGGDNNSQSSPSSYFSSSSSGTSPPSSCISSELNLENRAGSEAEQGQTLRYSNSPEATSMVLVGCPRCLMYVMLSEDDPKCPKCKSTCLLDFHQDSSKKTRNF